MNHILDEGPEISTERVTIRGARTRHAMDMQWARLAFAPAERNLYHAAEASRRGDAV